MTTVGDFSFAGTCRCLSRDVDESFDKLLGGANDAGTEAPHPPPEVLLAARLPAVGGGGIRKRSDRF